MIERTRRVVLLIDYDNLQICASRDTPGRDLQLTPVVQLAQRYATVILARASAEWNLSTERLPVSKAGVGRWATEGGAGGARAAGPGAARRRRTRERSGGGAAPPPAAAPGATSAPPARVEREAPAPRPEREAPPPVPVSAAEPVAPVTAGAPGDADAQTGSRRRRRRGSRRRSDRIGSSGESGGTGSEPNGADTEPVTPTTSA